ncbi:MAG: lipopolysaccharide heptosyltransferase II [Elusimicrobia bacterium]|nr:lipopolysaccharide heptosyltransferase II [Elusimicrobiota bacterium]
MGDVILTLPVFKNLKAHWPGCFTAALTKPEYAEILRGHPDVDEVIPFQGTRKALAEIQRRKFSHILDLHSTTRSIYISKVSGIFHQARYRKDALARRLYVAFGKPAPVLHKHTLDRYLESLSQWDIPVKYTEIELNGNHSTSATQEAKHSYKKILVIQTAFLGDAVLTMPLLKKLRSSFPNSHLSVLVSSETAEVFHGLQWLDEVIQDNKRESSSLLQKFRNFWRTAQILRKKRFELALIPHRSLRSVLLALLARIPVRIGFDSSAGSLFLTHTVPFSWLLHDAERNVLLLRPLTLKDETKGTNNGNGAGDFVKTDSHPKKLRQAGIEPGDLLIGIHPASVWQTKRWLPERFKELVLKLVKNLGAKVILVGSKKDKPLLDQIAEGTSCINWAGKTDLRELMELMPHLNLFITNDSGPMHLATAYGVPTLAIFGSTTRELGFFPKGKGHRVIEVNLACRPCGLHGHLRCPEGHFLCMRLVSTEQVYQAAVQMLNVPAHENITNH